MHIPDHFLDPEVTVATAVVAAAGVGLAVSRARSGASSQRLALAVVTTGLIFAAQMVNFSVLPGTSGHFLGGALAAALLGPWLGILSVSVVLVVQAMVFADGGLTALGTNIALMAVAGVACASLVTMLIRRVSVQDLARTSAGAGALVSVPVAAGLFCFLYALGGAAPVQMDTMVVSMVGIHALIGVAEAVITVAVLSLIMALAPGLAFADHRPYAPSNFRRGVVGVGAAALLCGAVLSSVASSDPDGLESVAVAYDFAGSAGAHALAGSPFADYGELVGLPVGLVGVFGTVIAAGAAGALMSSLARSRNRTA